MTAALHAGRIYADRQVALYAGDCVERLRQLPDDSVDAVVTDPPYGIGFMGKEWDGPAGMLGQISAGHSRSDSGPLMQGGTHSRGLADNDGRLFQAWCEEWARECLRILKPGGHLLAFGATRTWHRLAVGVEDAGMEIRDSLAWLYGTGFPKSRNVSRDIDKALGVEGTYGAPKSAAHAGWIDRGRMRGEEGHDGWQRPWMDDPEAVDKAAREYLPGSPEGQQWAGWGTALKPGFEPILVARKPLVRNLATTLLAHGAGALNIDAVRQPGEIDAGDFSGTRGHAGTRPEGQHTSLQAGGGRPHDKGRHPANVLLADDAVDGLTEAQQRYFYVAKPTKAERVQVGGVAHPTVKPLGVMRWLIRLAVPAGGVVVDPFAGSGTTLEAALLEGVRAIGVELTAEYHPLIVERIRRAHGSAAV